MMEKIDFDLKGVPHTLLLPLLGRALASQEENTNFRDERAVQLINAINYDFDALLKRMAKLATSVTWAGDRALYFDKEIKAFLVTHPKAVIVNLGAGFETAFYRVDNGQLTWVDLDVPDVMTLRRKLLPPPARVHYIDKSIFDFSWMDEVRKLGQEFFFFAGGVFIYFTKEEVQSIFVEMIKHFPQGEVVFDSINKVDLDAANQLFKNFGIADAKFQWGIDEAEVKSWSAKIKFIYHHLYTVNPENDPNLFHCFMTKIMF